MKNEKYLNDLKYPAGLWLIHNLWSTGTYAL